MLFFTTASLYTCTHFLVQCSIFSVYLSLLPTGTKHSCVLLFVLCSMWRLPHSLPNLREQALSWKGEGSAWRNWTSSRTIRACYGRHPLEEEESVQDGLIKWAEGHHSYSPTWKTLLGAMEYAGVAQQHCQGLRNELYQKLIGGCLCLCVYAYACVNVCVHVCRPACVWMYLRGKTIFLHCNCTYSVIRSCASI